MRHSTEHAERYATLVGVPTGEDWWVGHRQRALEDMRRCGFPTKRSEAWWGTAPQRLLSPSWTRAETAPIEATGLWRGLPTLLFVDGRFLAKASNLEGLPEGVRVRPLQSAMDSEFVKSSLGRAVHSADGGFAALGLALHEDGAVLEVEPGVELERPIVFVHLQIVVYWGR